MKKIVMLVFIVILGTLLMACGETTIEESTTPSENTEASETEAGQEDYKSEPEFIEVDHLLGTTQVPINPETVVVFDFGSLDTLTALGVEVAALPQANVPSYLSQYESDTYLNAGTLFEPDFETLANLNPDLIIISGRTQEAYQDLSELAPTIFMGIDNESYMDSFEENALLLGEIFNKADEVSDALTVIKKEIESVKTLAPEDLKGLILLTSDGGINAYGPGSRFGFIHDELNILPVVEDIEAVNHGQNISFEFVAEHNPDLLYVMDRNAVTGGEHDAQTTLDNVLINGTSAAENHRITYLSPDYWYLSSGGIESVTQMIEEIKNSLN